MRILYTENNIIRPYCKEIYVIPLVIIVLVSMLLGIFLTIDYIKASITFLIVMGISIVFLVVCTGYEETQGCRYYVFLENNKEIDLDKYIIEEKKGDLYIISDK